MTIMTRCRFWVASGFGRLVSVEIHPLCGARSSDHFEDSIRHPHNKPVGMIVEPLGDIFLIAFVNVVESLVRNVTGLAMQS
jgi:hypothetical protein